MIIVFIVVIGTLISSSHNDTLIAYNDTRAKKKSHLKKFTAAWKLDFALLKCFKNQKYFNVTRWVWCCKTLVCLNPFVGTCWKSSTIWTALYWVTNCNLIRRYNHSRVIQDLINSILNLVKYIKIKNIKSNKSKQIKTNVDKEEGHNWAGPGLVVMGDNSCSKGRGFESQHHILDGHYFALICCKIVCLKRPKINKKKPGLANLKKNRVTPSSSMITNCNIISR